MKTRANLLARITTDPYWPQDMLPRSIPNIAEGQATYYVFELECSLCGAWDWGSEGPAFLCVDCFIAESYTEALAWRAQSLLAGENPTPLRHYSGLLFFQTAQHRRDEHERGVE